MQPLNETLDDFVKMLTEGDVAAAFRKRLSYIEIEKLLIQEEAEDVNEKMWHIVVQKWIPLLTGAAYNIATIGRTPYYIERKTFTFKGKEHSESFPVVLYPWEYELEVSRDPDTREMMHDFKMKNVTKQPEIFSIPSLSFFGVCESGNETIISSEFGILHSSWLELRDRRQLANKLRSEMLRPKLYLEQTVNTQTQTMDLEIARFQEHLNKKRTRDENGYTDLSPDFSMQSNEKDNSVGLPPNMKFSNFQPQIDVALIDYSHLEEKFNSLIDSTFGLSHFDKLSHEGGNIHERSVATIEESRSSLVAALANLIREYIHVFEKVWEHMYNKHVEVVIPHKTHLDSKTITLLSDLGVISDNVVREKLMRMNGIVEEPVGKRGAKKLQIKRVRTEETQESTKRQKPE